MSHQVSVTIAWIPLSSVQRLPAIGKLARTRDGQQGTVVEFTGRCVVLSVDGKRVTVSVDEVKVIKIR